MLRNRFLGGVGPLVLFGKEDGTGSGDGGADKGAADTAAAAAVAAAAAAAAAGGADKGADRKGAADAPTLVGGKAAATDTGKDKAATDAAAAAAAAADVAKGADKGAWGEDWRDKIAEAVKPGDKKFRERLERSTSPADIVKSYLALEQRVSAGELKAVKAFPAEGTDAEKAAWRTEAGVPDKPEGYKIELKNGMVVGEADKPVVDAFAKWAHERNWEPSRLNDAVQFYYEAQDGQNAKIAQWDAAAKQKDEDALRAEFGTDFRTNINVVEHVLAGPLAPVAELLVGARLADGRKLGDDARVIKALAALGRELMPAADLVPIGTEAGKGVNDRLAEIRKLRTENPDKYDADKAMQAEELKLLDAQSRIKGRQAA